MNNLTCSLHLRQHHHARGYRGPRFRPVNVRGITHSRARGTQPDTNTHTFAPHICIKFHACNCKQAVSMPKHRPHVFCYTQNSHNLSKIEQFTVDQFIRMMLVACSMHECTYACLCDLLKSEERPSTLAVTDINGNARLLRTQNVCLHCLAACMPWRIMELRYNNMRSMRTHALHGKRCEC